MIEIKCQNCGSSELNYNNGLYVCASCGSRFLPEKGEAPQEKQEEKSKEEKLEEQLFQLDKKREKYQFDLSERGIDKWMEYAYEMDQRIYEILKLNPYNINALTFKMLRRIENGLKDRWAAGELVSTVETIIKHASEEEMKDVGNTVTANLLHHKEKLLEADPSLAPRIETASKILMEKQSQ